MLMLLFQSPVVSLIELIPTIVSSILVTQFFESSQSHQEVLSSSVLLAQLCDIFCYT